MLGLGSVDGEAAGATHAASKLHSIRRWVLVAVATESWLALRFQPYSESPGTFGIAAALLTVCAAASLRERWTRGASAAAALVLAAVVASVFPHNANHQWLAIVLLVLGVIPSDGASEEASDGLSAIRWVAVLGTAWAGVQKLLHGAWFGGEFLSFRIATDPGFAWVFGWAVPGAELERLRGLAWEAGAGPFRADAPLLVLLSNLTWLAELALPVALLHPATRRFAWPLALLFFAALQLAAREVFFAALMIGPLLLFAERDLVRRLLPLELALLFAWILLPDLAPQWRVR